MYGIIVISKKIHLVCNSKYEHAEAQIVKLIKKAIKKYGIDRTLKQIKKKQIILYRQRNDNTFGSAKCCYHCCKLFHKELPMQILRGLNIIYTEADGRFYQCRADKIKNDYRSTRERISKKRFHPRREERVRPSTV